MFAPHRHPEWILRLLLAAIGLVIAYGCHTSNEADRRSADSLTITECGESQASGTLISQPLFGHRIHLEVSSRDGTFLDRVDTTSMRQRDGERVRWTASHQGGPGTWRCVVIQGDRQLAELTRG